MADVSYHPEAEAEIQAAAAWYLTRSPAAAARLAEEIDRVVAMIRQFPELQPPYDERHRYALLRRFPYGFIYRVEADRIRVVAFANFRREPGYWQGRV
jgi:plasmid stabilization system protein ParE